MGKRESGREQTVLVTDLADEEFDTPVVKVLDVHAQQASHLLCGKVSHNLGLGLKRLCQKNTRSTRTVDDQIVSKSHQRKKEKERRGESVNML